MRDRQRILDNLEKLYRGELDRSAASDLSAPGTAGECRQPCRGLENRFAKRPICDLPGSARMGQGGVVLSLAAWLAFNDWQVSGGNCGLSVGGQQ